MLLKLPTNILPVHMKEIFQAPFDELNTKKE